MSGVERIAAERQRQVEAEGWTPEHDDGHRRGELAKVAATLAVEGTDASVFDPDAFDTPGDPWGLASKHHDPIRRLTIAGALIAAEIDRLERMTAVVPPQAGR